jgi:hypothetical protein
MKDPVGYIYGDGITSGHEQRFPDNCTIVIKYQYSQDAPYNHDGFILFRIEMPVGSDIGGWFDGVEQSVTGGFR